MAEIDLDNAVIVTRLPGTYELLTRPSPESPVKYWFENVAEGLTGPGTWMLDSLRGTLYLWNSEDGKPAEVALARLTELIRFQGEAGNPCRHIELEGLTFTHGD